MRCENNHSFDVARSGYVNLLLSSARRSKQPGDNSAMITSRRRFLEGGYYQPISDEINRQFSAAAIESSCIMDAGCGEGYYLARLSDQLPVSQNTRCYGMDISKPAVVAAARRYRQINWLVGSCARPPFLNDSLDAILCIFSRACFEPFAQALKPSGRLIMVTPASSHLKELRGLIYENVIDHRRDKFIDAAAEYFDLIEEKRVTHTITLPDSRAILDLLAMTPFFWRITLERKSHVASLDALTVQLDVDVRAFVPCN
ncbi:MAG: methyltransferase domain-containing protein [Gammaproteobacteria bacterium]|nr:methyltransferase domain-containing protein [Gammaproteobacteria bacterium]